VIRFLDVTHRYPNGREALIGVSFQIADGEMAFLTGLSGAGKSTLLRLIAGLERPTRGQLLVGQQNLGALSRTGILEHRRRIGMVFQDHQLLVDRPVWHNVALPLHIAGYSNREADLRVRAALDQVGLLDRANDRATELSVGERRRVGIARAVVSKPRILLADEPTGNVDPSSARQMMSILGQVNDIGITVVVASHDLTLIQPLGRRQITLDAGRLQMATHD